MWPNGKALDYESRDSRFDPWHGQIEIRFCVNFCSPASEAGTSEQALRKDAEGETAFRHS